MQRPAERSLDRRGPGSAGARWVRCHRRRVALSAAVAALIVLSGCTGGTPEGQDGSEDPAPTDGSPGGAAPGGPYEEPEWMLVERERLINYHTYFSACLEGVDDLLFAPDVGDVVADIEVMPDGTATGLGAWSQLPWSYPERGEGTGLLERSEAIASCAGYAEIRNGLPQLDPEVVYDRMVDTHRCLAAEGYDQIGELPARDELVPELQEKLTQYYGNPHVLGVAQPTEPWDPGEPLVTPYRLLAQATPEMGGEEWYRLKDACVEFGVSYTVAFLTEEE